MLRFITPILHNKAAVDEEREGWVDQFIPEDQSRHWGETTHDTEFVKKCALTYGSNMIQFSLLLSGSCVFQCSVEQNSSPW